MRKFLSRSIALVAIVLLAPVDVGAEEEVAEPTTAIVVRARHISVNDMKRRLLARYGREHVSYYLRNVQMKRALAAAKLTVDGDALEASRVRTMERIADGKLTKEEFLAARTLVEADFERIVFNAAAVPILAEAEEVPTARLSHFLQATQILRPVLDSDSPNYATVGGQPVTADELFVGFETLMTPELVKPIVEIAIRDVAIESELSSRDVNISYAAVSAEYARRKLEFVKRFGQRASFERFIEQRGSSKELYEKFLRREIAMRSIVEGEITDEHLTQHLKDNLDHFGLAEARARHILIEVARNATDDQWESARVQAAAIVEQLRKSGDFNALAKEHSADQTTKFSGGDVGTFPRRGRMVEPFAAAAFALKKGETSDPVRTKLGWHVIQTIELKPPSRLRLSEVRDDVLRDLATVRSEEWGDKLEAEALTETKILWDFLKR